jgi:hypothetical protein
MLNELVGQFLKSADGNSLLGELKAKGLSEQQATQAVNATAEGAQSSAGGLAGLAGGLLGGGGGSAQLAQLVSQKTGLALPMAQTVVSLVLPKLTSLLAGSGATPAGQPATSVGSVLKSLIR